MDPNDFEPCFGVVSFNDDLIGKYFYHNNKLVKVLRREGTTQVAVADAVTGKPIGYPTATSLIKAVRKNAINPNDYEPSADAASSYGVLTGRYYYCDSRLIKVLHWQPGTTQFAIADAVTGVLIGHVQADLLKKAVLKDAKPEASASVALPSATPTSVSSYNKVETSTNEALSTTTPPKVSSYDKFVQENPLFPEHFNAAKYREREQIQVYESAVNLAKLIQTQTRFGKCRVSCDKTKGAGVPEFPYEAVLIVVKALLERGFFTAYLNESDGAYLLVDIIPFTKPGCASIQ